MNFSDIKDDNGTTLKSYAELLTEKAKEAGFVVTIVFCSKERGMFHTLSNISAPVPDALIALGKAMKDQTTLNSEPEEASKPN